MNEKVARAGKALLLALMLTGALVAPVSAQVAGGTVTGSVADTQGGMLPAAAATITNSETGIVTKAVTNHDGIYRFSNLPAGTYALVVAAPGFTSGDKNGIVVTVGSTIAVNFTLPVGTVGTTVDVVGEESGVATTSAAISYDVPGPEIRELPLNGRDYTSLAALQPGVASIGSSGGLRTGLGSKMAISGGRPEKNNYLWDGISLNDNGNNSPGSVLGITLGVEAVDQFSLLTNSFSAEYGNTGGGVINAVTRSGTNKIHGSGFFFARNSAMDAANYFDVSTKPRPQFHRYQYGGSMGGPIRKDKTFWFADFEGIDQANGVTTSSIVPTALARTGALQSQAPVTTPIDPNVTLALNLYPQPNATCPAGVCTLDQGYYTTVVNTVGKEQFYFGKIDHKFTDKDSIRGNYFYDTGNIQNPDAFNDVESQQVSIRQGIGLEYTRVISPTVINIARAGFTRSVQTSGTIIQVFNSDIANSALAQIPGKDSGSVSIGGGFGGLPTGPKATDYNYEKFNTFQEYENLIITRGIHTIKVGADAERLDDNLYLPTASGGQYSFNTLRDFLVNNPSGWTGMSPSSSMERGERQTIYGFYMQDDIQVRKNLTANVGFRYEFTTIPTEVNHSRIAILHNLTDPAPRVGGPILDTNPSLKDFSPRVGLTWDPAGRGKTTFHAGFGEYDNLIMQNQYDMILSRSLPYFVEGVFNSTIAPGTQGFAFPLGGYNLLVSSGTIAERTDYIDPKPPRSYTMQWNFNIQQAFAGWVGQVGYVGTRGVHLDQTERNMNSVQPTIVNGRYTYPLVRSQSNRLNPIFASINCTDTFNTDSDYSSLQISVHRPLTRGLLVQGSYTWSKSMDDSSSTSSVQAGTGYPNAIGGPDPLIPSMNRGFSDFNIPNNAVISLVYDVHPVKTAHALENAALSGWEIGGIVKMQSGFPFTPLLNNDIAGTLTDTTGTALGQRPDIVPGCGPLTIKGSVTGYINKSCFTAPAQGILSLTRRNVLTAPGTTDLDTSFIKNDKLNERVTGQLRVEFFNILNHPNFSAPAFILFTGGQNPGTLPTKVSSAGNITSTTTSSRQLQVAYKVTF